MRRRALATVAVVTLLVGATAGCAESRRRVRTVMFGDSLLFEARRSVAAGSRPGTVEIHAVPGAPPCALLPDARREFEDARPRLVVIQTAGSNYGPCMAGVGALGTAAFADHYVRDVEAFVAAARAAGARVLVVDAPPLGAASAGSAPALAEIFARLRRRLDDRRGVAFTAGPAAAVTDHGAFALRLPCRPDETRRRACVDGTIAVRDPYFGVHFCPRPYLDDASIRAGCPVYSSGARRFGTALAVAARDASRG